MRIVVSMSSATSSNWVLSTFEASQPQFQLRHLVHLLLDHYKVGKLAETAGMIWYDVMKTIPT